MRIQVYPGEVVGLAVGVVASGARRAVVVSPGGPVPVAGDARLSIRLSGAALTGSEPGRERNGTTGVEEAVGCRDNHLAGGQRPGADATAAAVDAISHC